MFKLPSKNNCGLSLNIEEFEYEFKLNLKLIKVISPETSDHI